MDVKWRFWYEYFGFGEACICSNIASLGSTGKSGNERKNRNFAFGEFWTTWHQDQFSAVVIE